MTKELIILFENIPVRKVYLKNEWWISAVDMARAIGYSNPSRDSSNMLNENKSRFEGYSTVTKMVSVEKSRSGNIRNVKRKLTVLNLKGVIAFCMLSKLEKAIPFQRWADKVLESHIKASVNVKNKKYGEITDKTIEGRKLEVQQWKRHGVENRIDYKDLTLYEYELLNLKNKRKNEMSPDELLELTLSNFSNAFRLKQIDNKIYKEGIEGEMKETAKYIDNIKSDKHIKNMLDNLK